MPPSTRSSLEEKKQGDANVYAKEEEIGTDADFGGTDARLKLERRLLWKLDIRMSIMVIIYILNYVSISTFSGVLFTYFRYQD